LKVAGDVKLKKVLGRNDVSREREKQKRGRASGKVLQSRRRKIDGSGKKGGAAFLIRKVEGGGGGRTK